MKKPQKLSNEEFETEFRNGTLNPKLFDHIAHLRLAWIHITKYGMDIAKDNIIDQLKEFVSKHADPDKFNVTLTIASIKTVNHFILKSESKTFEDFIEEFPRLNSNFKGLINQHYQYDIFNSEAAKKEFIEPDLLTYD